MINKLKYTALSLLIIFAYSAVFAAPVGKTWTNADMAACNNGTIESRCLVVNGETVLPSGWTAGALESSQGSDIFTAQRYTSLRSDFGNFDAALFSEHDMDSIYDEHQNTYIGTCNGGAPSDDNSVSGIQCEWGDTDAGGQPYGYVEWCDNSQSEKALCLVITGGTAGGRSAEGVNIPTWSSDTTWYRGNIVRGSDNEYYISKGAHTDIDPISDTNKAAWARYYENYSSSATYLRGDIVRYGGTYYQHSTASSVGAVPSSSGIGDWSYIYKPFERVNQPCGFPLANQNTLGNPAEASANMCDNNDAVWGAPRLWWSLTNQNYVIDYFEGANQHPSNRLCLEYEMPSGIDYDPSAHSAVRNDDPIADRQKFGLGNVDTAPANVRRHDINTFGTYTCPRMSGGVSGVGGQANEECGGTYRYGGTHYYNNGPAYDRPIVDKAFWIDEGSSDVDTFLVCQTQYAPETRGAAAPVPGANPMQELVGETNGETDAYSYLSYLTRIYLNMPQDIRPAAQGGWPVRISLNRMFFAYENDDIFLYNAATNGVRSVGVAQQGSTVTYPVTLKTADYSGEANREYWAWTRHSGNLSNNTTASACRAFIDNNDDGAVDAGDTEIVTNQAITLNANVTSNLLITHTPDFTDSGQTSGAGRVNYSRKSAMCTLVLSEVDRMRHASYVVRTWEAANATEASSGAQEIIDGVQYPDPNQNSALGACVSPYCSQSADNQQLFDLPNSKWGVRNYPDYRRLVLGE